MILRPEEKKAKFEMVVSLYFSVRATTFGLNKVVSAHKIKSKPW